MPAKVTTRPPEVSFAFAFPLPKMRQALLSWYRQVGRPLPWRTLWLEKADPYTVWVSEIMLQQTVIKAMIPVYARFLERFPTLASLAAAEEEEVKLAVRGLGYYRRFRFMHKAAQELVATGSQWPRTFAGWKALPGVGDYTAAAVSSIAFNAEEAVVDGNVERVFCRLLDLREAPNQPHLKKAFQKLADQFLDRSAPGDFNQAVMELGQTVCTSGVPRCSVCPLNTSCLAEQRGSQALAPAPKIKARPVVDVALELTVATYRGRIALIPRPAAARFLGGTLGFLTAFAADPAPPTLARRFDGWSEALPAFKSLVEAQATAQPVGAVRHGITHHRITAVVATTELTARQQEALPVGSRLVDAAEVEGQLVANLDRKAWHRLQAHLAEQTAPLFA